MNDANPKGSTDENGDVEYEITDTVDSDDDSGSRGSEPRRVELQFPSGKEFGVYEHMRHRGDDETIVLLSSFGDGYQALAYDIDAAGQILDMEVIGHAADEGRAAGMCEYWLSANPKGILGDGGDTPTPTVDTDVGGGGGGFMARLTNMFGGG